MHQRFLKVRSIAKSDGKNRVHVGMQVASGMVDFQLDTVSLLMSVLIEMIVKRYERVEEVQGSGLTIESTKRMVIPSQAVRNREDALSRPDTYILSLERM
ncbi:MAG: hypothetical protein CL912_33685 [Deltaproteobacteria bacterium]|nr:hypothetical protein [Deltaproteobacteria bacterium]|tara:strand:+ start:203 stop:502 length:300 start_codon:yes stop_codon:yes gene_type:complete